MKLPRLPRLPRWLAPVLVVTFVLVSAWAGYNVVREAAASQASGSGGTTVDYAGTGSYGYVASMLPNTLFNSTTVSGTNVTLFTSITKWVNVTFVTTAALEPAAGVGLADTFNVTLSTAAWSTALERTDQTNGSGNTSGLAVTDRYDLNVSRIEALTSSIDAQLNYTATAFTVRFTSSVAGTVAVGTSAASLPLDSWLNLTFRGALIVPNGAPATSHGSLTGPDGRADPSAAASLTAAWVELAAALGALLVSVWLLWMGRKAEGPVPLPDLERLIEPYEEVIARTTREPGGTMVLPVDKWEDLVKVADTLGRPILRPVGTSGNPRGVDFYVYDGTVAYLYRHPAATGGEEPKGGPPSAGRSPGTAPPSPSATPPAPVRASGPVPSARPPTAIPARAVRPPTPPVRPPAARDQKAAQVLAGQLKSELGRIRDAPLDSAQRWYIYSQFTQAVRVLSSESLAEARRAVDDLRRTIDRALADLHPSG